MATASRSLQVAILIALILVSLLIVALLVLVSITFVKVNTCRANENESPSSSATTTTSGKLSSTPTSSIPLSSETSSPIHRSSFRSKSSSKQLSTSTVSLPQSSQSSRSSTHKSSTSSKSSSTTSASSKSSSTITAEATFSQSYDDGTLMSQELWDNSLCNPTSSKFKNDLQYYEKQITDSLQSTYPDSKATVNGFNPSDGTCSENNKKEAKSNQRNAQTETVDVEFTLVLQIPDGQSAPSAEEVVSTMNHNIRCNCIVTSLVETITTAEPTTEKHSRPPTSSTTENTRRTPAEVAADYLRLNMDHTARPCDDFYKFSCGNFKKYHQKDVVGYGTFDVVQNRVIDEIDVALAKINLTQMPDAPEWLSKTKRFYDGCMKLRQEGDKNNKRLLQIIDSFGGWPMIMEPGTWDEAKFVREFPIILANLTAVYGVQTLITAGVDVDWRNPTNFIPQIDQATLGLGNPAYYSHLKFEKDRQDYVQMIRETAAVLTFDQDKPQDDVRVRIAAQEILDFERMLSKSVKTDDQRKSYVDMYNPQVVRTIQEHYPFMNWQTYLDRLLPDNVQKPYNGLSNIVEPSYLDSLNATLSKMSKEKLANYLIWRLIDSLSMFMDDSVTDIGRKLASRTKLASKSNGVTATIRSRGDCTSFLINELAFASTRLLFKDANEKDDYKNIDAVKNMTERLMDSFKNQLDTLFWMDDKTRNEAKKKLDNYVELSEAPAWIFADTKLDEYYNDFKVFDLPGHFMDDYISLMTFHEDVQFRLISDSDVHKKDFPRSIWTLPPTLVNAWYSPEFNSITFPTGILRPPFFRHDFPWAVNFGALGSVVGHEMTHGFDDEGVQFNGTGYLQNWMTLESKLGFDRMIECVIRQYDHTCFPQVDMCIDGDQTQGENTADNGGIRAAYYSYRKYVSEFGTEQRLPGLENYTMEQIFFISFANVWCGDYETPEYLETQLVTNVHSPPPARVLNTLKNFAEFGRAFRCEVGQRYYPFRSDACYVWDSPPVSKNPVYDRSAERILENMNRTVRPCDNFYEYACGNFNFSKVHPPPAHVSAYTSADVLQDEIFDQIIESFQNITDESAMALQKAKTYFEICKSADKGDNANNTEILSVLKALGGWPVIDPDWKPPRNVATNVSGLIGELASLFGIQTLLVASSRVNPAQPSSSVLVLDQSSLALVGREYYLEQKLSEVYDAYIRLIMNVALLLANSSGVPLTYQSAFSNAAAIGNFELLLAGIVRPVTKRQNFTELFNQYSKQSVMQNFPNFDVPTYLNALVQFSDPLKDYFANEDAPIVITEPKFLEQLGDLLTHQYNDDNSVLQNYLLWRFIFARLNFMSTDIVQEYENFKTIKDGVTESAPVETDCVNQLTTMLGYTVGRLYVDNWKTRKGWLLDAAETVSNIQAAFFNALPQQDWMDRRSQTSARVKINEMAENIGYPNWILIDVELDLYYENYTIRKNDTYFQAFNGLNQFAMVDALESVLEEVDRKNFQLSPALVNAWYNPGLNSLTVPAAILNPPYYNPEFPTALKYGAIGVVMGHELTHAFDTTGIQFDGEGYLDSWMSQYSLDSYDKNVVQCIDNQYDHYCYFDGEYCIDGKRTQGENIADNGGIRQAFKAYRNFIKDNHRISNAEELMPGMEWFTDDQIFFLGFAQFWCGYYSDEYIRREILTDVHSPGPDRVVGSISNFVEFDKAFHCEIGEPMNPKDKCYVWTNPISTTDGYDKAAQALLKSMDLTVDPCDDFFEFACGNWINKHPVPKDRHYTGIESLAENAVLLVTSSAIENIDEHNSDTPTAFVKTKTMFDFCKSETQTDNSTGFDSFLQFVQTDLYGWPILTKFWNNDFDNIFKVVGHLGSLGLSTIFDAYPQVNYGPNGVTTPPAHYALFLDQVDLQLGDRELYINTAFENVMDVYRDVMVYTITEIATESNSEISIQSILSDVEDVIDFEKRLARFSLPQSLQNNYTEMYHPFTFDKLVETFPNINWTNYFDALLPAKLSTSLKARLVQIIVSEPGYIGALNDLLPFTSARTVQNYLIWRYLTDSTPFLSANTRSIHQTFQRKLGHLKKQRNSIDPADVVSLCTNDAINFLPWSAGRLYSKQQFGDDILKIKRKAKEITDGVIDQFRQRLPHLMWLDKPSLTNALLKLDGLIENIAYPDWIFNDTLLDSFYESLEIDTTTDYYTTRRQISAWFYGGQFMALNQTLPVDRKYFQESPAEQNAWYNPQLNSLTIPSGIIQAPFFDLGFPAAVNYGGLAAVAGHELTHGFDNDGVQFGPFGGLDYWMSASSSDYFRSNISQCVINQYDGYCYSDLPSGELCVNGRATQGENIADDGGTKLAYNAYKEWVAQNGYEPLLPGLEKFNMDQIFFLSFAHTWCANVEPAAVEAQLLLDVHSPPRDRVIGTLSDMVEFQAAFECKKGDKMVPQERCDVW